MKVGDLLKMTTAERAALSPEEKCALCGDTLEPHHYAEGIELANINPVDTKREKIRKQFKSEFPLGTLGVIASEPSKGQIKSVASSVSWNCSKECTERRGGKAGEDSIFVGYVPVKEGDLVFGKHLYTFPKEYEGLPIYYYREEIAEAAKEPN